MMGPTPPDGASQTTGKKRNVADAQLEVENDRQTRRRPADAARKAKARPLQEHTIEGPCLGYCCSEFMRSNDEPVLTALADLDTPLDEILSIVAPDNVEFEDPEASYAILEMPMRLVSNVLRTDALLAYVEVMVNGELRFADGREAGVLVKKVIDLFEPLDKSETSKYRSRHVARHPKKGLDKINKRATEEVLASLGDMVVIEALADDPDDNVTAACSPVHGPLTRSLAQVFPNGCMSRVDIGSEILNDIINALNDCLAHEEGRTSDPNRCYERLILAQLEAATTTLHEIGHAINFASVGGLDTECFYRNRSLAEAGYDIEHAAFGGLLGDSLHAGFHRMADFTPHPLNPSPNRGFLSLQSWPSAQLRNRYRKERPDAPIGERAGAAELHVDRLWRVPMKFAGDVFSQRFWDEVVPVQGKAALRQGKTNGWLFLPHEDGGCEPMYGGMLKGNRADVYTSEVDGRLVIDRVEYT